MIYVMFIFIRVLISLRRRVWCVTTRVGVDESNFVLNYLVLMLTDYESDYFRGIGCGEIFCYLVYST